MISLYMEPKAQATKVKLDKLDYIGIKNVSASKGTTEWKDNLQNGRTYLFIIHLTGG